MEVKYDNFGIMKAIFVTLDKMGVSDVNTEITKAYTKIETFDASHSEMICAKVNSRGGNTVKFAFIMELIKKILGYLDKDTYIEIKDTDVRFRGMNTYRMGIADFKKDEIGKPFGVFVKDVSKELTFITISSVVFKKNYNGLRKLGARVKFNLISKDGKGILKMSNGEETGEIRGNNIIDVPTILKDDVNIVSGYHPDLIDALLPLLDLSDNLTVGLGDDQPIIFKPEIDNAEIYILVAPNVRVDDGVE